MNEKLEKEYFNKILNLAFEKFQKEKINYKNSWLIVEIDLLKKFFYECINKLKIKQINQKRKIIHLNKNTEIDDMIDIINYCIMIIIRLKYNLSL